MFGNHLILRIMMDSTDYPMMAAGMGFGGGEMAGAGAGGPMPVAMPDNGALAQVDRVRNVFPETWLWSNITTGYMQWCTPFFRLGERSGKWNRCMSSPY